MNRFELARYEAGLTIAQAAERASVSIRTIRRAERGEDAPTAPVVKALADAYEKPVVWLLEAEPGEKAAA
jgi:transcriptional regulator with XRE-family HTH domain